MLKSGMLHNLTYVAIDPFFDPEEGAGGRDETLPDQHLLGSAPNLLKIEAGRAAHPSPCTAGRVPTTRQRAATPSSAPTDRCLRIGGFVLCALFLRYPGTSWSVADKHERRH